MALRVDEATQVLERTPSVLSAMLVGLTPCWLEATEGPNTWSPRQVVTHLLHIERTTYITRARIILAHHGPRDFTPIERLPANDDRDMALILADFAEARAANVAELRGWQLTTEQLFAEGIHPAFGPVNLGQLIATWAAHDLSHVAQVARVMARVYKEEVGPWRAYLPIMG